jgi:hypothetical protein
LLIADPRPALPDSAGAQVRRYRLARLRFDGRDADPTQPFEHLKRVYD